MYNPSIPVYKRIDNELGINTIVDIKNIAPAKCWNKDRYKLSTEEHLALFKANEGTGNMIV